MEGDCQSNLSRERRREMKWLTDDELDQEIAYLKECPLHDDVLNHQRTLSRLEELKLLRETRHSSHDIMSTMATWIKEGFDDISTTRKDEMWPKIQKLARSLNAYDDAKRKSGG